MGCVSSNRTSSLDNHDSKAVRYRRDKIDLKNIQNSLQKPPILLETPQAPRGKKIVI